MNPPEQNGYTPTIPPFATAGYACYNHPTLVDLLKPAGISWRYYAGNTSGGNQSYGIWRAPDMIQNICQPTPDLPDACSYAGYTNNVYTGNPAEVLNDLGAASCNLQRVSWVIPDGSWSDHPGPGSHFLGSDRG
jgi:phospholipase C